MHRVVRIEYEDVIEYREDVGMVLQDVWDAAETQNVNIRLGRCEFRADSVLHRYILSTEFPPKLCGRAYKRSCEVM
jgi:hypothetical protein